MPFFFTGPSMSRCSEINEVLEAFYIMAFVCSMIENQRQKQKVATRIFFTPIQIIMHGKTCFSLDFFEKIIA